MKKKLILVAFIGLFLLTGCGTNETKTSKGTLNSGTLNCTKAEYDEDGYKTTDTMVIKYKKNIVTNVSETNVSEMDPDTIDISLAFGNLFAEALSKLDGMNVKYTKLSDNELEFTIDVDYSKVDLEKVKDTFGDAYDESQSSMYTKDVSLDTFKADILDGYTCK